MNRYQILFLSSMRRGFRLFFAPMTGAVKGIIRGIRDEYREIEEDYRSRMNNRPET